MSCREITTLSYKKNTSNYIYDRLLLFYISVFQNNSSVNELLNIISSINVKRRLLDVSYKGGHECQN